jgi:hypothetical protein
MKGEGGLTLRNDGGIVYNTIYAVRHASPKP